MPVQIPTAWPAMPPGIIDLWGSAGSGEGFGAIGREFEDS